MTLGLLTIILGIPAIVFLMFIAFWRLYFLRKPERKIGKGIVSPANGKVERIIRFGGKNVKVKKGLLGGVNVWTKDIAKKGWIIVIVMTPFHVHYQRAPISGRVEKVEHKKGKFLNLNQEMSLSP